MMLRVRVALAAVFASITMGGCAAEPADRDDELVAQTHAALSLSSLPRDVVALHAEAVYLPSHHAAIVDLALSPIPEPPTESDEEALHETGSFDVVMVYSVRADGSRAVLRVLTAKDVVAIGPGGGCIHFLAPGRPGDRLFIGGVVRRAGEMRARLGVAPITTVTNQIPGTPPNQWPFAALDDHALPAP